MTSSRNSLAALLAALALAGFAAAQDGSGIPRDPSQDAPERKPPKREGSLAVPLPPEGTIGNPATPTPSEDFLPSAEPEAGQAGDLPNPTDGGDTPVQPGVLDAATEETPNSLPMGELPADISRRQLLEQQNHDMQPSTVTVEELGTVDASETGTLDEAGGGLGGALWDGSDYPTVADLLDEMPVATLSPAMNALARRVLLTGAKPADPNKDGPTLFDIRTAKLAEAGLTADLVSLLDAAGGKEQGDPEARAAALLLAGRESEACGAADAAGTGDVQALPLRALCQIAAGVGAAAALSADLARVKGAGDAAFFALVAHLAEGAPLDPAALKGLTPVTLALARRAKAEPGMAALEGATPGVLAALAADTALPADLRLAAGEAAAARGAMDGAALLELFRSVKFKSAEFKAAAQDGARGGALLVQAAIAAEGLEPRAKAIEAAMAHAGARGLAPLYAALLARAAWEEPPSAALAPYADTLTRILLATGRADRAADWLNAEGALPGTLRDETELRVAVALPTPVRAAAASGALARLAAASAADAALAARVLIYAGALDAMGYAVPPEAQSLLQSSPQIAGAPGGGVETAELAEAAQAGRKGETILRALILLGAGGPAEAHPASVIEAVAALARVGLTAEASEMALEAALARPRSGGGG